MRVTEATKTTPMRKRVQNPCTPLATSPASMMATMSEPATVPTMVPGAAEDRRAADEDAGDDDEQVAHALVGEVGGRLERQEDPGEAREKAHQGEDLEPRCVDRNADDVGDLGVVAEKEDVLAEGVAVEDEPEDRRGRQRP